MLTAEQLIEVAEALNCTGAMYRYRMRLAEQAIQPFVEDGAANL